MPPIVLILPITAVIIDITKSYKAAGGNVPFSTFTFCPAYGLFT